MTTISCNVSGSERKRMVMALSKVVLWEPVYAGPPSFAYKLSNYSVSVDGEITCPEETTAEMVEKIVSALEAEGFEPVVSGEPAPDVAAETPDVGPEPETGAGPAAEETEAKEGQETPEEAEESAEEVAPVEDGSDAPEEDATFLTYSIPRKQLPDDALLRLKIIVKNKEELFKRALQLDELPIVVTEEEISFPWFNLTGIDGEAAAYGQFLTHLCQMAKEQTRVREKPYDGDNDRFAMRIFMVRLGMKGPEYSLARKLMMKHLTGNSGWRYGTPPKKTAEPEAETETHSEEPVATEEQTLKTEETEVEENAEGISEPGDGGATQEDVPDGEPSGTDLDE